MQLTLRNTRTYTERERVGLRRLFLHVEVDQPGLPDGRLAVAAQTPEDFDALANAARAAADQMRRSLL